MAQTRPPGVSEEEFAQALKRLTDLVGEEHVLTGEEAAAEHRDPYALAGQDTSVASAVVSPASTEEVQEIVRLANEYRIPLWTVSQGRNNGYGGAAPRVSGSVVVSLRRMNRVLEVNEECGYAVVEPGVRYFDLYEHLQAGGHRLMVSVPDLGWGSVVGNALDHGVGYEVYGDHAASVCGMEVVLPDGDILRTGMGAMTGSKSWHVHTRGFGPSLDDLFKQSNLGIVTKMGVWLLPTPERFAVGSISVPRRADLGPLIDTLRPLMLDRVIDGHPVIANPLQVASTIGPRERWYQKDGPIPDEAVDEIARTLGIGHWTVRFSVYGPKGVVDAKLAVVEDAFSRIPGAAVVATSYPGGAGIDEVERPHLVPAGIPNMDILESVKWYSEQGGHLGFAPVLPLVGRLVQEWHDRMLPTVERFGFDPFSAMIVTPRSIIDFVPFLYDMNNQEQVRTAYDCCRVLIKDAAKVGYGEYRAHLDSMDLIAEQFDFNDHAVRRFTEKLKDAVDPAGILAPGKQGIWPAALRPARPS
ncbi:FAD-binding oxidoreductase [Streptomyces sp. A30]|uniref:FAD-binding oxidoreductase n=1 Tax=Streptomyces sp. A30 TaxID=2789273 RepID=UPI00397F2F80